MRSGIRIGCASVLLVLAVPLQSLAGADACPADQAVEVRVGKQRFAVEVAATPRSREIGLSAHTSLAAGAGMWFVMPKADEHGFWMREMKFPIDLVWIDAAGKVLDSITLPVCPAMPCPLSFAPAPALYVLEVNAGAFSGKPGDRASWRCGERTVGKR